MRVSLGGLRRLVVEMDLDHADVQWFLAENTPQERSGAPKPCSMRMEPRNASPCTDLPQYVPDIMIAHPPPSRGEESCGVAVIPVVLYKTLYLCRYPSLMISSRFLWPSSFKQSFHTRTVCRFLILQLTEIIPKIPRLHLCLAIWKSIA